MQLTYKFRIPLIEKLVNFCKISKDLYNQTNYVIKQELDKNHKWLRYNKLDKIMKVTKNLEDEVNYEKLKAQTSQQIIKLLDKNWASYFKTIKDYKKHPEKYKAKPESPNFKRKDDENILIFTNQNCKIKDNVLILSKDFSIPIPPYKGKDFTKFQQVRILPRRDFYEVEIVYNYEIKQAKVSKEKYASIDLGVNNVMTLLCEDGCLLYNGKQLKSINQYCSKQVAKYQSEQTESKKKSTYKIRRTYDKRNLKITDLLHKLSKRVINYCITHEIGNIVVGYNEQWKTSTNLGNKTNQIFVSIPHRTLINMLQYKGEMVGVNVIANEESYTSKCDGMGLETLEHHDNYMGKRVKRGLFQSSVGKVVNADVNGALNIQRKVVGNSCVSKIVDRGFLFNPVKIVDAYGSLDIPNKTVTIFT
jgi:IS605 OrfB family transposase